MAITLSSLRTNLYKIVDEAISTGIPVEITRNGHKVRLVPERKAGKLGNLKRRKALRCDPKALLNLDWSSEWKNDGLP